MTWNLSFGHKFKELQALKDAGANVPALDRRPVLDLNAQWAWNAYVALDKGRNFSFGQPHPIALSEILAYKEIAGVLDEDIEELVFYVRLIEDVYFEHLKNKVKNGGTGSHNRRSRGRSRKPSHR